MKRFKNKQKIIIVLILTILIFSNSYLLAKYTSSLNGNNSTSIAKWNVTYSTSANESDTLNLISGNTPKDYIIQVTSTSEVSAKYSIILSNVPNEMEVKIDDKSYKQPINNNIVFEDVGVFSGNDINTTFTHTLTFNAPLEANIASNTSVEIKIKFDQID